MQEKSLQIFGFEPIEHSFAYHPNHEYTICNRLILHHDSVNQISSYILIVHIFTNYFKL